MFKRLVTVISLITLFAVFLAPRVLAVDVVNPACENLPAGKPVPTVCSSNLSNVKDEDSSRNPIVGPDGILTKVISILALVLGVISVIVIIIAGIRMATSQGNPQTVSSVRNQIIYAAVGIAVAVLAQSIVVFVIRRL